LKTKSSEISGAIKVNPVRNSSGGSNPGGIIKPLSRHRGISEERGIISNGVNRDDLTFWSEQTTRLIYLTDIFDHEGRDRNWILLWPSKFRPPILSVVVDFPEDVW